MMVIISVTFSNIMAQEIQFEDEENWTLHIQEIEIWGNKTTKNWIIVRELDFGVGDTLSRRELLERFATSKQNLTNTSLFNFVDTRFVLIDSVNIRVYVILTERWYLWPRPIFELAETNFNSWWENKDFSRINYGIDLVKNNFRGRNEKVSVLLQFGFTQKLRFSYAIPYINRKRTLGLTVYASYGQNHEVNYISDNNKRLFYKDIDEIQQRNSQAGFNLRYRKKFYSSHFMGASYNQAFVTDSILSRNPDFMVNSENFMRYLNLSYKYSLDHRDNKSYALKGHYFGGQVVKNGLGILDPTVDLWWTKLEYKHYWILGRKTSLAGMVQTHFYWNDFQPYYFRDGLGYTDKSTVRSYELYVIDAQQMGTGKLQFRYQLSAPKKYELGLVPINKFKSIHYAIYLGVFTDIGYAYDFQGYPENNLANDLQVGSGLSIDVATYYDLVFRFEYSINKFGEHGLFLHFVTPI